MTISDIIPRVSRTRSLSLTYRRLGKRTFDVAFTLLVSPFVLPLVLILAVIIRRDGGSAFYGHERIGRNGAPFRCLKLRTMAMNSKEMLEKHLAENDEARAEWDRDFKLKNDPRITKIGSFLRKTSLDELPQFLNVVRGELSVVGPRPVTKIEIDEFYGPKAGAVLKVRPGITGPWQVGGRNDVDYDTRIKMDLEYVNNQTFLTDLSVILKTVSVVLLKKGN